MLGIHGKESAWFSFYLYNSIDVKISPIDEGKYLNKMQKIYLYDCENQVWSSSGLCIRSATLFMLFMGPAWKSK